MSSLPLGSNTSPVEVTHVSSHGIWLLAHDEELFLPYTEFPCFLDQPLKAVMRVEEPTTGHFYWLDIDVDLSLAMIREPDKFPLESHR